MFCETLIFIEYNSANARLRELNSFGIAAIIEETSIYTAQGYLPAFAVVLQGFLQPTSNTNNR